VTAPAAATIQDVPGTDGAQEGGVSGKRKREESRTWKFFRFVRWFLALLVVLGALAVFAYWLHTGMRLACQVTTVVHAGGIPSSSTGTATTTTCGLPPVSDFIYVLAVVGVLLIPDAGILKIGGLHFERLSNRIEAQSRELNRLSNTVHQTFNFGVTQAALTEEVRAEVRRQKQSLADLESYLPTDDQTRSLVKNVNDLPIDKAPLLELLHAGMIAQPLIEQARMALARRVTAPSATQDEPAEEVFRSIPTLMNPDE
jgi:hypothetical protein